MSLYSTFNKGAINELGGRHISVMEIAFPLGQDPKTTEASEILSTNSAGVCSGH